MKELFSPRRTKSYTFLFGSCGSNIPGKATTVSSTHDLHPILSRILAFDTTRRSGFETLVVGMRGSGKSALQEASALVALAGGATVVDLYGAAGGEQLGWVYYATGLAPETRIFLYCFILRSRVCVTQLMEHNVLNPTTVTDFIAFVPWPPVKILLVVPDNVAVYASGHVLKAFEAGVITATHIGELVSTMTPAEVMDEYNVVLFPVDAFMLPDAEPGIWDGLRIMLEWVTSTPANRRIVMLLREAATLAYVRGKLDEKQSKVKALIAKLMREARHVGMNVLADTQRIKGVESNVREIVDTIVFKRLNPVADVGTEVLNTVASIIYGEANSETREAVKRQLSLLKNDEFLALHGNCVVAGKYVLPPNHVGAGGGKKLPIAFATPSQEAVFAKLPTAVRVLEPIEPEPLN